ncbi:phosphotransferase family protein [Sphingobium sp. HBC34]|uniref:Phosphotransferase family protein n=1 Tax=Sphingobium cyanobacteriorum TaxID=3063954 RepID=A0ABT8ZQK0_9SPHN|nr:phosphotransferase family protein [Sphingobium sp. HBC34]MDO7836466.1 phosphotransferase family protein [Sphingobium sp. HBC34]
MEWKSLVDLDRLTTWMDQQGLGSGPIEDALPLAGGTQNVLLRFRRGDEQFVLRRPPLHSIANGSETMRREARTLAVLADSDVPHARLVAACPDDDVLGAAFYLMRPVEGFTATVGLPALHASDAGIRRQMGFSLVDGALALGRIDPIAAGLGDMGKLDNYLGRQSARWRSQYDGYAKHEGWTTDSVPGVAEIGKWLDDHCPAHFTPGLIHGDYHLGNVMFRLDGPDVAAIVDWELTTIGDPLIDMGWLLATWPDREGGFEAVTPVEPWDGFPDAIELVERYAAGSGRDCSAMLWYKVLACYKLGIILEGSNARALAGKAEKEIGDRLHHQAVQLLLRASRSIEIG